MYIFRIYNVTLYDYLSDTELVPELYYIDLKKNRINGFLNQRRETISLENRIKEGVSVNKCDDVQSFFS